MAKYEQSFFFFACDGRAWEWLKKRTYVRECDIRNNRALFSEVLFLCSSNLSMHSFRTVSPEFNKYSLNSNWSWSWSYLTCFLIFWQQRMGVLSCLEWMRFLISSCMAAIRVACSPGQNTHLNMFSLFNLLGDDDGSGGGSIPFLSPLHPSICLSSAHRSQDKRTLLGELADLVIPRVFGLSAWAGVQIRPGDEAERCRQIMQTK